MGCQLIGEKSKLLLPLTDCMSWLSRVGVEGGGGGMERCLERVVKFSKSVEMEDSFFKFRSRPNIELFMTRTKLEFGST